MNFLLITMISELENYFTKNTNIINIKKLIIIMLQA